ncbi:MULTISPECIES: prolipoprotein diacylglyceryl transferase [Laceyella]|jgi:phosphatidylglycerol:prolipoprotein diacylglycerol transferase|uniref:Phosphatidylglycerol--prolipoprotein diacylglyceryl transferase n=1 Tax=Laceyella sediminis TaxID=573074 RepID=A0ABX5ERM5_9BACL|nr:prolipoprotein diacylglyceryl transferase [Laceyella sediminis]MRG29489.1 prolipoprotein diacylglyceryl transferase [Laceyella tengchongensis]PRZ16373.1 prolipoprotein diacylglyceryl transferase [Laceyella sediminis]
MWQAVIDPVAFKLGPFQVHWYGVIMGTAALLGLILAVREGERRGLDSDTILDMMLWILPSAIVGARLYYVLFEWEYYAMHPEDIVAVWKGGLAIHGGLIAAFLVGYIFVKKKNIDFLQLADIVIPSVLLGQAIGRWGNFINQEAHGGEVSRAFLEGLHLPDWIIEQMNIQGAYYHPTFFYESMWNLVGFGLLLLIRHFNPRRGEVLFSYMIWYSLGRFFIEGLRTDSLTFTGPDWLVSVMELLWSPMSLMFDPGMMDGGNVRIAQLVSLILVLVGAFLIIWRRATGRATAFYRDEATIEAPATASAQDSAEKEPSASPAETKTNAQAEEKEGQAKA